MQIENRRELLTKEWSVGDILVARWERDAESVYYLVCDNDTLVALNSGIAYEIEDVDDGQVVILCGHRVIIEDAFENDEVRLILGV